MSTSWAIAWEPMLLASQEVWPIRRSTGLLVSLQFPLSAHKSREGPGSEKDSTPGWLHGPWCGTLPTSFLAHGKVRRSHTKASLMVLSQRARTNSRALWERIQPSWSVVIDGLAGETPQRCLVRVSGHIQNFQKELEPSWGKPLQMVSSRGSQAVKDEPNQLSWLSQEKGPVSLRTHWNQRGFQNVPRRNHRERSWHRRRWTLVRM